MIITTFIAEFKKEWIDMKRYPIEWVSSLILLIVIFYGIFLGASYISGKMIQGENLSYTIVSYAQYTLLMGPIYLMGLGIVREAQHGTLEQLFLAPVGISSILIIRSVVTFFYQIIMMLVILEVIMLLTGKHLNMSFAIIIPLITTYLTSIGIGFLITSIAVVSKRISQFLDLLQFVFLFLVMIPFTDFKGPFQWIAILVPYAPSSGWLRDVMIHNRMGTPLIVMVGGILNGILWLSLGLFIFKRCVKVAKRRATLSHY
ncbi:ABC transporter permease [Falsibacillus pallidus]|uniref:ABC transporter permease n=1 Tax=Falsibacillus pallidus TaxID=493781 RepID=UPI000E09E9ED|nr:ABC transporter permease [Falsibacillus pallidus]